MKIIQIYDKPSCFTQGLCYSNDHLFESSGLYNQSFLRNYGSLSSSHSPYYNVYLPSNYFAEDITAFNNKLYQLTYREHLLLEWTHDLNMINAYQYPWEGWGLCNNGKIFYSSDGSSILHSFIIENGIHPIYDIHVTENGKPIDRLNSLEWMDGIIYANRWMTPYLYLINPKTGHVLKTYDCTNLYPEHVKNNKEYCFNGITKYDNQHILVTGKMWNKMYKLKIPSFSNVINDYRSDCVSWGTSSAC